MKRRYFLGFLMVALTFTLVAFVAKQEVVVKSAPAIKSTNNFDLAVANEERLVEMLRANGTIKDNASAKEVEQALNNFLVGKMEEASQKEMGASKDIQDFTKTLDGKTINLPVTNGLGNKLGLADEVAPIDLEAWDGSVTEDNILVILMEFPDYPHNSVLPEETDMYYEDYVKEHYQQMLFSENGYEGPNGEQLMSMKQYYEAQSGGSYTVNGQVAGWYMSNRTAVENDIDTRGLVKEALVYAALDPNVDLSSYDQEDKYDLDGDGNYREPDGLIDHLMIFHSGIGEEAGGGALGEDAIWSHSWDLGGVFTLPNTTAEVPYWGGSLAAYDYTIQPIDAAVGVCAHEYGHDLGLPDEYDTNYTGQGEPVSFWSLMASGSWAGTIPGSEPTGFSPYGKLFFQQTYGGNWLSGTVLDVEDLDSEGTELLLDQASVKGTNNDVVIVNLPDKENVVNQPASGSYEYFSGSGNGLDNYMLTTVDLTDATQATMTFKAWYQIEQDWDYASVGVYANGQWYPIEGNITTTFDPYGQNPGYGITGHSDGWVDAEFDLSQFAGQVVYVGFNYWTDPYVAEAGLYVDDIAINVDGNEVVFDDAENDSVFDLYGFTKGTGTVTSSHFYLLEWRNHVGTDAGLGHIKRGNSLMSFDPGLVIWYADTFYDNNHVGLHPGDGYIGVVDADQHVNFWSDKDIAATRYQVHDAAFSLQKTEKMYLDYNYLGFYLRDNHTSMNPLFDDSQSYINPLIPDAGRNVPNYGLKIRVTGESEDRSVGQIRLFRD